jgi:membrane protease YdiL (CAAX protease family)
MLTIRNDSGEVRLAWRLVLIIFLYVAVAVLLRFIPIRLLAANLIGKGDTPVQALERATAIVYKDPVFSTVVIGILSGLMGLLLVWLLERVVEKAGFTWESVGLDWKRNSLLSILLGAILAFLLFIAYIVIGYVLGSTGFSVVFSGMDWSAPVFFQQLLLYLTMGFGEEIVFRGYVQNRLVERHGANWGIPITAVVFVLLHQVSYGLSPVVILSGLLLWTTIGILYNLSQSLYLVIAFHGLMNTFMNASNIDTGGTGGMIVHAFALSLAIFIALVIARRSGIRPKTIEP